MTGFVTGSAVRAAPASLPSRSGFGFWISLFAGIVVTILLYVLMLWIAPRFGLKL